MLSPEDFIRELDRTGACAVRDRLMRGLYSPTEIKLVEPWLDECDRQSAETITAEQIRLSRSAARAAWIAAIAAVLSVIGTAVAIAVMQ